MADPVLDAIERAAKELGVDPQLAKAIAKHESGFNPTIIGDHGCSHGLFQLNTCGGEGVGMTLEQLQDPYTNASRALTEVAAVAKAHPDWSPGQIAAAAQRPADPAGYASAINSILVSQGFTFGGSVGGGLTLPDVGDAVGTIAPILTPGGIVTGFTDALSSIGTDWVKDLAKVMLPLFLEVVFVIAGIALVSMGLHRLTGRSPVEVFQKAKSTVDTAALAAVAV